MLEIPKGQTKIDHADHYTQTNTNNIFMWTSQDRTQNVKTHNKTTQETKKMSNTDPTKKPRGNSGAHER
jgi:hypothetical protein